MSNARENVNLLTSADWSISTLRLANWGAGAVPPQVILKTNYIAGDGGGLFRYDASDTTTADNSGTVIVDAAGNRWKRQLDKSQPYLGSWFGILADSVTNNTAALNNAIASIPYGSTLLLPQGEIRYTNLAAIAQPIIIRGAGTVSTILMTTTTTGTKVPITGSHVFFENIGFDAIGVPTAGAFIDYQVGANNGGLSQVALSSYYVGIRVQALGIRLFQVNGTDATPHAVSPDSCHVLANNNSIEGFFITDSSFANDPAAPCTYGIRFSRINTGNLASVDFRGCIYGVVFDPSGSATFCGNVTLTAVYADACRFGFYVAPSDTAIVVNVRSVQCWYSGSKRISSGSHGVTITRNNTATIANIKFVECNITENTGDGVNWGTAGEDIGIIGGVIADNNGNGITIGAGLSNFTIIGALIGSGSYYSGNTGAGISISAGASNNYIIEANNILGNGSSISDGGTGTTKRIANNLGFNPTTGYVSISVGASPFTWTNNLGNTATLLVNTGTVSQITLDGNIVAGATNTSINVPHESAVEVTYAVLPQLKYKIQ
jgi:hypothetical protein